MQSVSLTKSPLVNRNAPETFSAG